MRVLRSLLFASSFAVVACSSGQDDSASLSAPSGRAAGVPRSGSSAPGGESGSTDGSGDGHSDAPPGDEGSPPPLPADDADGAEPRSAADGGGGVLTAGVWDDNRNYSLFTEYRRNIANSAGAPVTFDNDGYDRAHATFAQPAGPRALLDVALVIDTTGSMQDELAYVQAEFVTLTASLHERFPQAAQRWALVVYRDDGDEYVTRAVDFHGEDTRDAFVDALREQYAYGGGDYPEVPDRALTEAAKLSWREGDVAKLAFWVADAPPHDQQAMAIAVRDMQKRGVHIYPVASSGIDGVTELTMRSAAQITGGRYLFLTDDSGVGDSHAEPTIPCYFVTKLDAAIERMVAIEMTGTYHEPSASEVIRVGGDPKNGVCRLADGHVAFVF